jgi:hypothetical protein
MKRGRASVAKRHADLAGLPSQEKAAVVTIKHGACRALPRRGASARAFKPSRQFGQPTAVT